MNTLSLSIRSAHAETAWRQVAYAAQRLQSPPQSATAISALLWSSA